MKVSKYTFFFIYEDEYYVYNSLSNALMKVDRDSYLLLADAHEGKKEIDENGYEPDLYKALSDRNIITDNDDDDFLKLKSIIFRQRVSNDNMHLTLAPTMDCCFRCHYCFEKYKEKGCMSAEVMDSIIKYIEMRQNLKSIKLTWFGGEPLMAVPQIEMFYDKFIAYWKDRPFSSNIITTGYHIDKDVIRILDKVGVKSVQITLDGNSETHNKVKNFPGSGDTFEKVLRNAELYNDMSPDVNIVFRVNLTLDNADEYIPLFKMFLERFKGRKMVAMAPAFVLDRSISGGCKTESKLFNNKQCSEYVLHLAKNGVDSTYIRYPERFFYECAIRNDSAISFDPKGYAYKCWELIGNKEYAIGRLDADGHIVDVNEKIWNRLSFGADPFENQACINCKYLPICNGGCPIHRIENKFGGGKNNCCSLYKGYMEEFLKEHLRRKKIGIRK